MAKLNEVFHFKILIIGESSVGKVRHFYPMNFRHFIFRWNSLE